MFLVSEANITDYFFVALVICFLTAFSRRPSGGQSRCQNVERTEEEAKSKRRGGLDL